VHVRRGLCGSLPIVSFLLLLGTAAQAQPAGWTGLREFQIVNDSAADLTDYQVPVDFDSAALIAQGEMSPSGDDLRFAADCGATPLDYWLDPTTLDTSATRVWVKVPLLKANATTPIEMFTGNPDAQPGSTLSTFAGPLSATHQVFENSPSSAGDNNRGFRFAPKVPIFVTELGRNEPNGTTRAVVLWDVATQTQLKQLAVSGPAAQYSYASTGEVIPLQPGADYLVQMHTANGDYYYYTGSTQVDPALTYKDMRYCNGCTENDFPTSVLSNMHYGFPDFTFYAAAARASPEVTVLGGAQGCTDTSVCNADCQPAACGDTVVNPAAGEQCDDGNTDDADACRNDCQTAVCGDAVVQTGVEKCDDGNGDDTDGCLSNCHLATCGDGVVQAGVEACDDGNGNDSDECTNACTIARCGDGSLQAGIEACDDGNAVETDACHNDCTVNVCGDAIVQLGVEQCDDGNDDDTDACHNDCTPGSCGDGMVQTGEQCDDGNRVTTDACTASCQNAVCGDGITHVGVEQCDDGNQTAGDGCSADCKYETSSLAPAPEASGCGCDTSSSAGALSGILLLLGFVTSRSRRRGSRS
jgi:cysteine-rich repeat protein